MQAPAQTVRHPRRSPGQVAYLLLVVNPKSLSARLRNSIGEPVDTKPSAAAADLNAACGL